MRLSELIRFCRQSRLLGWRQVPGQFELLEEAGLVEPGETSLAQVAARVGVAWLEIEGAVDDERATDAERAGGAAGASGAAAIVDPEVAEDVVLAVIELCATRYVELQGALWCTNSTAAPLSSLDAYRAYGPALMRAAWRAMGGGGGAKLPGRGWARLRAHVELPLGVLVSPIVFPYLLIRDFVHGTSGSGSGSEPGPGGARRSGRRTSAEWADVFFRGYMLLAPPALAVAAWFGFAALGRPAGAVGIGCGVAVCVVAYVFGMLSVWVLGVGFAMDHSPERARPPSSRVRELFALVRVGLRFIAIAAVCPALLALLLHAA